MDSSDKPHVRVKPQQNRKQFRLEKGVSEFYNGITYAYVYNVAKTLKIYISDIYYNDFGLRCGIKNLGRTLSKQKESPKHMDEICEVFRQLNSCLGNS